jgi:hypothetical protein
MYYANTGGTCVFMSVYSQRISLIYGQLQRNDGDRVCISAAIVVVFSEQK